MSSGDYPEIAQLPGDVFSIGGMEALEFGPGSLLDGMEGFIAGKRAD